MSYVQSLHFSGVIDFVDMGFSGGDSRPEAVGRLSEISRQKERMEAPKAGKRELVPTGLTGVLVCRQLRRL